MQTTFPLSRRNPYHTQIACMALAAFFGLMAYPFTRTSAAPYFNAAYGSEYLSWAMIAAALLAILVVIVYNNLAKRLPLITLCIYSLGFVIIVNLLFWMVMGHHPRWMALVYYAWSDVYIMILVEQFWSISNTLFDKETAKRCYGLFLACSAAGSVIGNAVVTKLSVPIGSHNLILLSAVCLSIYTSLLIILNGSISGDPEFKNRFNIEHYLADRSAFGGATLVLKNSYLTLIMLLVIATQLYINGAYFVYNNFVAASAATVEKQSVFYSRIFLVIELSAILLNLAVTPLALKFMGVAKTHYSIVAAVIAIFILAVIHPQIAFAAVFFAAAKSFDYSIYRAAKEILYIPLHIAEKFQAKVFIDVFVYRFAKAIAAFGIILAGQVLSVSIFYLIAFGIIAWLALITAILRIYKRIPAVVEK